jgi:Flp pilus assembly protein TadD
MTGVIGRRRALAIAGLAAVTTAVFWPLFDAQFLNWDDPFTLTRNDRLDWPGVLAWAFTTDHMGHYQPLSWLSWSAVKSVFGLDPLAFHGLNLIGHLANAVLVYLLAVVLTTPRPPLSPQRTQRTPRGSGLAPLAAAMLFAIHPVQVEVVAWASAFPYILSLFWVLVALLAYLRYAGAPSASVDRRWLFASACAYVLSLASRAAAIGLPLVLLVLDVYPLQRAGSGGASAGNRHRRRALLVEKLPFVVASLVAVVAESRSREITGLEEVGVGARLTAAAAAPFVYLGRMILPLPATPVDPRAIAPQLDTATLVLSLAALVLVSALLWTMRRQWPALLAAWAIFLVLLGPIVGLTPTGQQATADRYMYFPAVVLALVAGGALATVRTAPPRRLTAIAVPLVAIAVLFGIASRQQSTWWRDSITLWTRAADLDPRNDIATYNLAIALADAGREQEAMARYEQTLKLVPDHGPARHNLSLIEAARAEREADSLAAHGRLDEAIALYSRALERDPGRKKSRASRGIALTQRGRYGEAVSDLRVGLEAKPDDPALISALAFALVQTGESAGAVTVLKQGLAHRPDDFELAHNLARVLATAPEPSVRDGATALRLALAVRDRVGGRDPRVLDTLAAAYAASGQIALARQAAAEAVAAARQLGDREMAEEISRRARTYVR